MCVRSGAASLIRAAICRDASSWVRSPLRTASSKVGAGVIQIMDTPRSMLLLPPAVIGAAELCGNKTPERTLDPAQHASAMVSGGRSSPTGCADCHCSSRARWENSIDVVFTTTSTSA